MSRNFFLQIFFHESSSPKPLKITLGSFENFWKIRKLRWTTGINDTCGKFWATSSAGVVDTGGKFVPGANYTGSKFATIVNKQYQTADN